METTRNPRTTHRGRRGSGLWDGLPQEDSAALATVAHGPYMESIPVADTTVAQIRERFSDRFDIHPESRPFVDGEPVRDDYALQAGEVLQFMRHSGVKGVAA